MANNKIKDAYMKVKENTDRDNAIEERVADNRLDEETFTFYEYKLPTPNIMLIDLCDIHYGGQGYEHERTKAALEISNKFFNGFVGIGGDFFDNANIGGATNPYGAKVSPSLAEEGAKNMLAPYKGKIKYVLGGNHEAAWGKRQKDSNIDMSARVADNLNVKYARHTAVIRINLLDPTGKNVKPLTVCIKHEIPNAKKFVKNLTKNKIYPDIIIGEHIHTGIEEPIQLTRPVFDKKGFEIGEETYTLPFITGYSMQNGDTYYGAEKSFAGKTNVKAVYLNWENNPDHSNKKITQPKYRLNYTPFDLLDDEENIPSMICKDYLIKFNRPSIETVKNKLKNKPLTKLTEEFSKF